MTTRTSMTTVTFAKPFVLGELDEVMPAGTHTVETDEELVHGISFVAYRRILTTIHLNPKPGRPGRVRTLTIDAHELDAAIERDQAAAKSPADLQALDRAENEGMTAHRG
jgi:hypothetical protein